MPFDHTTSLSLSFLFCNTGMLIVPTSQGGQIALRSSVQVPHVCWVFPVAPAVRPAGMATTIACIPTIL